MSLKFNCSNIKNESPMMCKRFIILGDGLSTKLSVSLVASPVGMEFRLGSRPCYAYMRSSTGPELSFLSITGETLTFDFERPIPTGEWADVQVDFLYEGVFNE